MNRIKHFFKENWPFLAVVALMALLLMCGGCASSRKVMPVMHDTVVSYKDVYHEVQKYDSIYIHDSMWMEVKGDTVWIDKWHTRYAERVRIDTMSVVDTQYVQVDVPYEVYKEKKVYLLWPSALILIAACAVGCYWYIKRKR